MNLKILPIKQLNGKIIAPSSKSYSHRAFIAASLGNGISIIKNPLITGDVKVTIDILKLLGVKILEETKNSYIVRKGRDFLKPIREIIDCKNSGTSIRVFSALSLLIDGGLSLTGEFINRKRPIIPLLEALKCIGGEYELLEDKLKIQRKSKGCNKIKIQGDISSQFITALLFISSIILCENRNYIDIEITTPLVSYPYIQITLEVLRSFGINIFEKLDEEKKCKYLITCGQNYRPQRFEIPGDFSSAAFIIVAATLSKEDSMVIINNLNIKNPQGDKRIIEILQEMGAKITINDVDNQVIIEGNINKNPLKGIEIDCVDIPDLFPILSVVGAFAQGKTTLYNASNLRLKESNRISVMARELNKMGVKVEEVEDRLTIYHCDDLKGFEINHENDHRIAMACCISALYSNSDSLVKGIEIVRDSYPSFIEDLKELGANIKIV